MSLTRFALERDRVTLVLVAVLLLTGVRSYLGMPQAEDPGFTIRTAVVITHFPGASPERVEQLVTDKLEKVIQEIPQLDSVLSESKNGVSIVTVNIQERFKQMRPIWDDLRRKVEKAGPELPEGIIGPTVNDEFGDVFGTIVTLTGDGYSYVELEDVAEEVRDELLLIGDVAKVEIHGVQDQRIFVDYNNARLAELGLSPLQLQQVLEARNIINPGGQVRTDDEIIVLEPSGSFASVEELGDSIAAQGEQGEVVLLRDIAHIYRGTVDPPDSLVRVGGEPGVTLAISMRDGGNIVDLGVEIRATIDRVRNAYPYGVELDYVQFQADAVSQKVSDFIGNLVQAVAIVLAVMLLSLGLRTGLVVSALIPAAIVMAFIFMPMVGVGIDQMSLAALIIALGMLVDNAIVMSESVLVQMGEGKPAFRAAIDSAQELRIPLLTSSLTTAAAFLPIFLAESAVGEYTGALFKVVTITLLCSWLLSLTLIPLLCVRFLRAPARAEGEGADVYDNRFYRGYRGVLLTALRRPLVSLVVVILVFLGSLQLFRFVPSIFFPENDRPTLTAELILPTGAPLSATESVVDQVEAFIQDELAVTSEEAAAGEGGITTWATYIGEGAPRFFLSYGPEQASPEYAILLINTSTRVATDEVVAKLRAFCAVNLPGVRAKVDPLGTGPGVTNPIEVRLSGRDADRVFAHVDAVKGQLAATNGTRNISDNWGARSKKLLVEVDGVRARRAGVTNQDVAISLQTLFSGFTTTEFREDDKIIPVTLRSAQAASFEANRLRSINIFAQGTGQSVPIGQVADIDVVWQPAKILRRDRLTTVTITSDLEPGFTARDVTATFAPWLTEQSADWPIGYSWELGGEDEASGEANASIGAQLPTALMIIILLLVAQFNSIRRPAIILLTIPLGLIGVVIGLIVLRSYFGFMTLLGVVSLAGIVINNAIVLLDRIRIEIEENGSSPQRAVVEAAQRRLRPILLTTLTTLAGMIPLYLGGGPMFEPMAVAIMFGLIFATALTLGVVPVLYALFFRVKFRDYAYGAA